MPLDFVWRLFTSDKQKEKEKDKGKEKYIHTVKGIIKVPVFLTKDSILDLPGI